MSKRVFSITAALVFFCSSAWAQLMDSPWPKIHNNVENTGYSSNIGTSIGRLKWYKATGKPITSSPVLDNNGRIYFGSADTYFYCLDRNTGNTLWRYKTGDAIEHCSAAIDANGYIYIGSNDRYLYAFDLNTINVSNPQPAWRVKTTSGIYGSPTIANNGYVLFSSADGYFYCIDPTSQLPFPAENDARSNNVWYDILPGIWSTPTIDNTYNPGTVIIGSLANLVSTEIDYALDSSGVCYFTYKDPGEVDYFYSWFLYDIATGTEIFRGPRQTDGRSGTYGSIVMTGPNDFLIPTDGAVYDDSYGYQGRSLLNNDNITCSPLVIPVVLTSTPLSTGTEATPALLREGSYYLGHGSTMTRFKPTGTPDFNFTAEGEIRCSAAVDETFSVYFGCNGGVFYCLNTNTPGNPLRWRFPETGSLKKNDGTPAEIISSPAIDDDAKHSIYFGASDGTMYALHDGASISGTITFNGSPLPAVDVVLKDAAGMEVATVTTDINGYFEFYGYPIGTYTVRPKKDTYIFNPVERPVTLENVDVNGVDFTAATAFTLIGKVVRTTNSQGMEGVSISLVTKNSSGIIVYTDNSTVTDADGNYSISNVGYGTSTITPFLAGWGFSPPSIDITFTNGDDGGTPVALETFAGTEGYQVSGKVIDATKPLDDPDNGLADVTVTITSSTFTDTRTTNPQGQYSFTGLADGTYIVKPTRALYKFSPTNRTVVIEGASVLDQNFYGATGSTISGTLKLSGDETSFDGFVVNLYRDDETFWSRIFNRNKPRTLVTTVNVGDDGFFIFMGVAAGKYIVEPAKDGYSFNPASEKVTMTGLNDIGSLVFTAVGGFSISGKMTNLIGIGESGIGLTLVNDITDDTYEAISGLDGSYTFTGLESGSFTIIPEQTEFNTISPASKNVIITTDSVRKVNFKVYSLCTKTFITIPFWGTTGSTVNIIGSFFGTTPALDDTSTVAVTLYDGTTASVSPGVYFGTNDPASWVKATVDSWSPVYITAKVPVLSLRVVRVWVVRPGLSTCITNSPANFFINTNQ